MKSKGGVHMANSMSVRMAGSNWSKDAVADDIVRRGWRVAFDMGALGVAVLFVIALVSLAF